MAANTRTYGELLAEIELLQERLEVAESTLVAIQEHRVDAFLIQSQENARVYTLEEGDFPYKLLVEKMEAGAALLSGEGVLLYANPALSQILEPLQPVPTHFRALVVREHQPSFDALLANPGREMELQLGGPNGPAKTFHFTAWQVPSANSIACYGLIVRNVAKAATAVRPAQAHNGHDENGQVANLHLTQESEARFRLMADNAPIFIWVSSPSGREFVNASFAAFLGHSTSWLTENGWSSLIHPDDLPHYEATYAKALESQQKFEMHFRLRSAKGEYRWVQSSAVPRYSAAGAFMGYIGSKVDIHDMIVAQEERRAAQRQLQIITSKMTAAVYYCGVDGRYQWVSPGYSLWLGLPMEQIVGHTLVEIVGESAFDSCENYRTQVLAGRRVEFERKLTYKGKGERWVHATCTPTMDDEGDVDGFVAVVTDVTGRKEIEGQLREANERLEDRVASRTVQLRNLAITLCQTEQRERKRMARELHDNVQQLLVAMKIQASLVRDADSTGHTLGTIASLADEAIAACRSLVIGLSPPVLHDFALPDALAWLAQTMQQQHDFTVDLEVRPLDVLLEEELRTLLFDVARELLLNVVKHAGVSMATLRCFSDKEMVHIEVEDKGAGCDPEVLEAFRTDSFGLFSIRERLATMGGELRVQSIPGGGTCIRALVPCGKPLLASSARGVTMSNGVKKRPDSQALRVLVVDDHEIFRQSLTLVFSTQPDMQVVGEAADGIQALELAQRLQADVVIMDITMPGLSGIEATRILHAAMPHIHIIGLSTLDSSDAAAAMLQAGAVGYVSKHEPAEALLALIRTLAIPGDPSLRLGQR